MATAETDTHLELKKRARRRLVGAVALALLAAIVLPMVMDQEPKPLNQDIQVRIPGRDLPVGGHVQTPTTSTADRKSAAAVAEPAPAVSKQSQAEDKTNAPLQDTATPVAAEAAAKPIEAAAKPVEAERLRDKIPDKVDDKSVDKIAKSAQSSSAQRKEDEARARAILTGEAQPTEPAAGQSGQFVVQLGVFKDPGNARKVQARVKSEGYNSFAEQLRTATGAKTRVRAGPFASRELAEKAREKLKQHGVDGIVAPKS